MRMSKFEALSPSPTEKASALLVNTPGVYIWTHVLYFQNRHYYALIINVLMTIRILFRSVIKLFKLGRLDMHDLQCCESFNPKKDNLRLTGLHSQMPCCRTLENEFARLLWTLSYQKHYCQNFFHSQGKLIN